MLLLAGLEEGFVTIVHVQNYVILLALFWGLILVVSATVVQVRLDQLNELDSSWWWLETSKRKLSTVMVGIPHAEQIQRSSSDLFLPCLALLQLLLQYNYCTFFW